MSYHRKGRYGIDLVQISVMNIFDIAVQGTIALKIFHA